MDRAIAVRLLANAVPGAIISTASINESLARPTPSIGTRPGLETGAHCLQGAAGPQWRFDCWVVLRMESRKVWELADISYERLGQEVDQGLDELRRQGGKFPGPYLR